VWIVIWCLDGRRLADPRQENNSDPQKEDQQTKEQMPPTTCDHVFMLV